MAWVCGNCGAETTRSRVAFDEKGFPVRECCPHCAPPGDFADPFRDPTDNKIYAGPHAFPHLYKRNSDGVYQAKDELIADTAALWDGGPSEQARRRKEQTRRTEPMSQEEIERSNNWGREVIAEAMRRGGAAAVAALLSPSR